MFKLSVFQHTTLFMFLLATSVIVPGCFSHNPETTAIVVIQGISADGDRKQVSDTLKGMADGSSHFITSSWSGNTATYKVSPVGDIEAFAKKINFGEVTKVEGRTVTVQFVK